MTTEKTTQTTMNASYVINPVNGQLKGIVANKEKKEVKESVKVGASFAKNKRYSIYNNGGGYTGL